MKRWIALMCATLLLLCLTACGKDKEPTPSGDTEVGRQLGMGSVNTVMMDGTNRADLKVTVAALVLDPSGKIADCAVDELAFSVTLEGGVAQAAEDLKSKLERGDHYLPTKVETGMETAATRPWHEQVEAFCDYAEGKTPDQITGLATTDGKSGEIKGCDLILTDFIQAVGRAAKAAKPCSIAADDDLELALTATREESATEDKPQYDVEMAAVTVGDGDRITGCMTDTLQAKLTIMEGVFSTLSGGIETKRQMGDGYGMKAASSIQREWYEQADAFDKFAVGKTPEQLAGTRLNNEGKADAIAGCTVIVSGMLKNAVKAADRE